MKVIFLFFVTCTFTMFAQEDFSFPMKGDFIYYEFKEQTSNTKNCVKYYFGTESKLSQDLQINIASECLTLNKFKIRGGNPTVGFDPPFGYSDTKDCLGEIFSQEGFSLEMPSEYPLIENTLLFTLLNRDKLKVIGEGVTASVKLKFYSKNEYSLILTNFKIMYLGKSGSEIVTEILDLEEVYKTLLEKGKQDDKMYNNTIKTFMELDEMLKTISQIYSKELKRIYQLDEL